MVALVVGCSDYDLNRKADGAGTDAEETGAGPETNEGFSDVCPGLAGERHEIALNEECNVDLQTGSFTPVVEYDFGNSAFCGPPAA